MLAAGQARAGRGSAAPRELDQAARRSQARRRRSSPTASRSPGQTVGAVGRSRARAAARLGPVQPAGVGCARSPSPRRPVPRARPRARCPAPSPRRRAGTRAARGSCGAAPTRAARERLQRDGIQGETDVANGLAQEGAERHGLPRWMSRALQSLTSTEPKMCSAATAVGIALAERVGGRSRSRARARCPAVARAERGPSAAGARPGRAAGAPACLRRPPSWRARGSRPAGGASSAAAARRRAEPAGRGWSRARSTSRSRRSRRSPAAGAASTSSSGTSAWPAAARRPPARSRAPTRRARCGSELVERALAEVDHEVAGAEAEMRRRRRRRTCRSPGSQDPEPLQVVDRLEEGAAADRRPAARGATRSSSSAPATAVAPAQPVRVELDRLAQRGNPSSNAHAAITLRKPWPSLRRAADGAGPRSP